MFLRRKKIKMVITFERSVDFTQELLLESYELRQQKYGI
jgi:hypothetical protein